MDDFAYRLYKRIKWTLKSKEYMNGYDYNRFSRIIKSIKALYDNGIIPEYDFYYLYDAIDYEFGFMSGMNGQPVRAYTDNPARYGVYFTI